MVSMSDRVARIEALLGLLEDADAGGEMVPERLADLQMQVRELHTKVVEDVNHLTMML